jgi:hypothetical protein
MSIDKDTVIATLTTISAVISGYMLYKSNASKDRTKTYIETLDAESNFRDELLKSISELKNEIEEIREEKLRLKDNLYIAEIKIKNLERSLSEKVNKCKVLENFLKYLTIPAWFRLLDSDNEFRFAFVNFSFCNYFEVSNEYCIGQPNWNFISEDFSVTINKIDEYVLSKKIGSRHLVTIKNKVWNLLKFPIIEDGKIIGLGGMLVNCEED